MAGVAYGITAGGISAGDAAYIHGTVCFALTRNTMFVVTSSERRVEAEIGAGDDNWDLQLSLAIALQRLISRCFPGNLRTQQR